MTFNWSGQGGYPSWYWGGSDGTNMYVYNPLNLPFLRNDVAVCFPGSSYFTQNCPIRFLGVGTESQIWNDGSYMFINPAANLDGAIIMGIYQNGHRIMPYHSTIPTLGFNDHLFGLLYTYGNPVVLSDRRKKKDIEPITEKVSSPDIKGFLKELSLVWYRLKEQDEFRYIGLIAQEVEPLIEKYHLPEDWSFFHKTVIKKEDGEEETHYSLSYDQIFFLMFQIFQEEFL